MILADTHVDIDVGQVILAISALAVALGIPSVLAARSSRRNEKALETGNGKALGETVHDMAATVEALQAQVHTNTGELLAMGEKIDSHIEESVAVRETIDAHIEESTIVHERLLGELGVNDRRETKRGRNQTRREGG